MWRRLLFSTCHRAPCQCHFPDHSVTPNYQLIRNSSSTSRHSRTLSIFRTFLFTLPVDVDAVEEFICSLLDVHVDHLKNVVPCLLNIHLFRTNFVDTWNYLQDTWVVTVLDCRHWINATMCFTNQSYNVYNLWLHYTLISKISSTLTLQLPADLQAKICAQLMKVYKEIYNKLQSKV